MPMADWLYKYPGVAALLQTDTDEVLGASAEEDASAYIAAPLVSPLTEREAWYDAVLHWAEACIRCYQAQGFYLCVAPDIYASLLRHARPAWEPGPLHVRAPFPGAARQLRLFTFMQIVPWASCASGTWLAHWSDSADHPRVQLCAPGTGWWHPMRAAIGPVDDMEVATLCHADAPALLCPCGGFLLHWGA